MGKELGFMAITEYEAPDLVENGSRSFIDVVWKSRSGIAAAFEVRTKKQNLDVVPTQKDMIKLDRFPSQTKFIVNVSETTGKAYFHKISSSLRTPSSQNAIQPIAKSISGPNKQEASYSVDEIRLNYPKAYKKWTPEEDAQLTREYKEGLSVIKLAEMHQRKDGAIRSRLVRLGLVETQDAEYSEKKG
jgi:hypothetical protein